MMVRYSDDNIIIISLDYDGPLLLAHAIGCEGDETESLYPDIVFDGGLRTARLNVSKKDFEVLKNDIILKYSSEKILVTSKNDMNFCKECGKYFQASKGKFIPEIDAEPVLAAANRLKLSFSSKNNLVNRFRYYLALGRGDEFLEKLSGLPEVESRQEGERELAKIL